MSRQRISHKENHFEVLLYLLFTDFVVMETGRHFHFPFPVDCLAILGQNTFVPVRCGLQQNSSWYFNGSINI